MLTRLVSFGFKYGIPVDADLVLDVRFLDNPYFVPGLRDLRGTDAPVIAFVTALPETKALVVKARDLLEFMLPRYEREGKSYLTIAIGCTGGRHRSVVLSETLAADLATAGYPTNVVHRDIARGDTSTRGMAGGSEPPKRPDERQELLGVITPAPASVKLALPSVRGDKNE